MISAVMKISNKNKRSQGRPSLRCISVRRAHHHHSLNFSVSLAKELNLDEESKVNIIKQGTRYYLSLGETGYNIRVKHNGGTTTVAPDTLTCSSVEIVNTLLSFAGAEKVAKFIIGANCINMNTCKCYLIIPTPLRVD